MKRYEDQTGEVPFELYVRDLSPVEIDTQLAQVHAELYGILERLERARNSVFRMAGRREYIPATWQHRRSRHVNHGTYEEAVEVVNHMWEQEQAWRAADFAESARPDHFGDYDRNLPFEGPQKQLDEAERLSAERYTKLTEIQKFNAEYARRPWPRYWLVVSSAGHIHKSTNCQTCRATTAYGWMPQMSGQTEEESVAALGRHADSLCSVCFPTAPVAAKRTNVTKAQATKLSAATYVPE